MSALNVIIAGRLYRSELIAPQLFKIKRLFAGMETKPETRRPQLREEIIKQLEHYSVEVLEAALLLLQMRQSQLEK
jgi:hypothetical protein